MTVHDRIALVALLEGRLPEGCRASESPGSSKVSIHTPRGLPLVIRGRALCLDGRALTPTREGWGWLERLANDVVKALKQLQGGTP